LSGATSQRLHAWKKWAFALVPAVGIVELVAHVAQTRPAASSADWDAARDYVAAQATPQDLVAFAPHWVDPVGREHFGPRIATLLREAPPDETRFPRALEVSIRGAHLPELDGWRPAASQRFGGVTVTTWENPNPAHVIDDLVAQIDPQRVRVTRGAADCPFQRGGPQSGGLGYGPAIPGDRFVCNGGGFVGVSVVPDLEYRGHRCIYAPPQGAPLRIHFLDVHFGTVLHGHHAIYVEAERDRKGTPVTITFTGPGDVFLGAPVHRDGDGWKGFDLDTSTLNGQHGELVAEIASSGERRMYCFEAETR
jgi:hypothetical protein